MCVLGSVGWSVTVLWSVYCSVDSVCVGTGWLECDDVVAVYCSVDSVCVVIGGLECDGVVVSLLQCR